MKMNSLSKLIIAVTGMIAILPGYLIFTESDLLPPSGSFNSLILIVTEFVAFTVVVLTLVNRKRLEKITVKKMNIVIFVSSILFISVLFMYSSYLEKLVLKDDFGSIILPVYNTHGMTDKLDRYGSMTNFFRETDSITLNEFFNQHEDIGTSVLWSKILLFGLFILSIILLIFVSLVGAIRLKSANIEV